MQVTKTEKFNTFEAYEIRLECLKQAVLAACDSHEVMPLAQEMYHWAVNGVIADRMKSPSDAT